MRRWIILLLAVLLGWTLHTVLAIQFVNEPWRRCHTNRELTWCYEDRVYGIQIVLRKGW